MKKKILFSIIGIFLVILICMPMVQAGINPDDMKIDSSARSWNIDKIGGRIIWIVQFVGYAIALVSLMIMGVKYMIESPEGKADLKKRMIPFVIGAFLLFGASTLVGVVANFAQNNVNK